MSRMNALHRGWTKDDSACRREHEALEGEIGLRGSGNVFRDLGHADADREQLRALLAARIGGVLDERKLAVQQAHNETGIANGDFSRIRKAKLDRFAIDRLMAILSGLGREIASDRDTK